MKYVCYELDEDPGLSFTWYEHFINYFAIKLEPKVNPDFYKIYNNVVYWWLELNKEDIPLREIGFNADGKAIVAAPFGENRGIFTHGKPKVKGFYPVEMYQFACEWDAFVVKNNANKSLQPTR